MTSAFPPRATARLQFRNGFTLDDACGVVDYLAEFGVSHVYASPILTARSGSTHGYDTVDYGSVDPVLGGEAAFRRLSALLAARGMGLIVDFVPNHMGVGDENAWWMDVLTWGQDSIHAPIFDIDWSSHACPGKVLLPILDRPYAEALAEGTIGLAFDRTAGTFAIQAGGRSLPLSPASQGILLRRAAAATADPAGGAERLHALAMACESIRPGIRVGVQRQAEICARDLATLARARADLAASIERTLAAIVAGETAPRPGGRRGWDLHDLLEAQHYRLAHWRLAATEINYRRFFDIDDLIGIRVEDPSVFAAVHEWLLDAAAADRIQGVRLDHIDGLADPGGYLRHLRAAIDGVRTFPFTIHVEKILAAGEPLPADWPVEGTTGYETMAAIHDVLVDRRQRDTIEGTFRAFTGNAADFASTVRQSRKESLNGSFLGAFEGLVELLSAVVRTDPSMRDLPQGTLREALETILVCFPRYRIYVRAEAGGAVPEALSAAVDAAAERLPPDRRPLLETIARLLSGRYRVVHPAAVAPARLLSRRFQQLTGAVAAKSVEDTAFYRHVPLASLNEVGGEPGHFGLEAAEFHAFVARHVSAWPQALIPLATHDHKRGADVRARLAALSEWADEWDVRLAAWSRGNGRFARMRNGRRMPAPTHEYLFYQTLLGVWPASGPPGPELADRLAAYMLKAAREGKVETAWIDQDPEYEAALEGFVRGALDPDKARDFHQDFTWFAQRIARAGAVKSLAQLALQMTLPGIPDHYQGTERWDLSLVDPDNRRPVDYAALAADLRAIEGQAPAALAEAWIDGRVKQSLAHRLLGLRRDLPELFARGTYRPVEIDGPAADDLLAWHRSQDGPAGTTDVVGVCVRRVRAHLGPGEDLALDGFEGCTLVLPGPGPWRDLADGSMLSGEDPVALGPRLRRFPVMVLASTGP